MSKLWKSFYVKIQTFYTSEGLSGKISKATGVSIMQQIVQYFKITGKTYKVSVTSLAEF